LVPLDGATPGVVRLTGQRLTIGRGDDCDLIIRDPALSRRHAAITWTGANWRIEDLGSANGTTVAGRTISTADLSRDDIVSFGGQVSYRFIPDVGSELTRSSFWAGIFCYQLVPEAGGRPFVLRRRLSVVGRNATADLRLIEGQVSSIHARIVRRGKHVILRDTGSRNGTSVNGKLVRESALVPGDRVAFGDRIFAVKPSAVPTGRALTGAGSGVLLIALIAIVVSSFFSGEKTKPLWTRDLYLNQVETSLVAFVRAFDRSPPAREVALAQFEIARRSLIGADLLRPDRQTAAEIHAALHNASAAPGLHKALRGRDIVTILAEVERDPQQAQEPPPSTGTFDLETELSYLVAEFGIDTRDTPMPDDLVAEVERYTNFWSVEKRKFTTRSIERGRPHLEMMRRELRAQRLPQIFCYLPFIESGYQDRIISTAGARGFWQFMPGTARDYGLRVDDLADERTDPLLSTRAACQYLEYLLKIFGPNSFMCAVAAYNKGHNGMLRCLNRGGDLQSSWKFWNLTQTHDGCLPAETKAYVPRFLAAVVVFRNPDVFGLAIQE
jgi:pSer/pThr/pTyr-binding forkhead associated (FHA) protein